MMKNLKRFLAVGVALMAMVIMTGCGGNDSAVAHADDVKTIGFVTYNLNDTFLGFVLSAAQEQAQENGIDLRVADARGDLLTQQDEVNALIQAGANGLIVIPVDTSGMGPIVTAATDAGIPLVFVNRNPFSGSEDEMPEGVYFVGSQEITAGIMQMEFIGELLGGEGNVAIAMGTLGLENTFGRTQGVRQTIEEQFPNMSILAEESANFQREEGVALAENWISSHGSDLHAIIANNDEMALGALVAAQNNNREDILIVGIDATPNAIASVEEGGLAATVFQDAVGQGSGAVDVLSEVFDGNAPNEAVRWIAFQLVTSENVADFS